MKRTIEHKGKKVTGTHVGFTTIREDWNEYTLSDGTTLKVKVVLTDVLRVEGEHDAAGDPVYITKSVNHVVNVSVPDHLRKEPE